MPKNTSVSNLKGKKLGYAFYVIGQTPKIHDA